MGYTKDAVRGFSWQSAATLLSTGITAGKLIVLARLLTQQDFGLFALISIALGLTEAITQTGINITIIQSSKPITYYLNTAWVIAIIRGFVIAIIMGLMGVIMATIYHEPTLIYLVAIAGIVPIIKGFINPAITSWQKNLQFEIDTSYRLSLVAVETLSAILLALIWPRVEVLIFSVLVAAVFEVTISFGLLKLKPAFMLSKKKAQEILLNARGLSLTSALDYFTENVDEIILGRTLGTSHLGTYHAGYSLSHRPTVGLAQALNHSTLPVFTKIGADRTRLRRAFIKSSGNLMLLSSLAAVPLIFFPEPIIMFVLGNKWMSLSPVLPWLGLAGISQTIIKLAYNLLISQKSYRLMNWHRALTLIILAPLLISLSQHYGLTGAGIAWVIARLLPLPLLLFAIIKILK